ncbi:MAG: hypothetical protein HY747_03160 [Elusimicrobia bacterium]|nr:hypothetical protein [Elusimicrobiota bacterium]
MSYEAYSVRSDRLPSYLNKNTSKSFLFETFWRHPAYPDIGFNLRILQAGRTIGTEKIGDYQTDPLRLSIQSWYLVLERDLISTKRGFLAGMAGIGEVANQFERVKPIIVQGADVSLDVGLNPKGTQSSGVRVSIENAAFPLGVRWHYRWSRRFFSEAILTYAFLFDMTDVLSGSSPYSGWATKATAIAGWRFSESFELYGGYLGYVNHMAAPTGQGGMKLRGSASAPEGIYVLWQENEVHLSAAVLGLGYHF